MVDPDMVFVGIDLGTSGCRGVALDGNLAQVAEAEALYPAPKREQGRSEQDPACWWLATQTVLLQLRQALPDRRFVACSVAGTSGSCLLTDAQGEPLTSGLMYDDQRGQACSPWLAAGGDHPAADTRSSLARLLWLTAHGWTRGATHFQHQADWIAGRLSGCLGASDYHNALRLGFDPERDQWADWVRALPLDPVLLPKVTSPGHILGTLAPTVADALGLASDMRIVTGTTDSVAAFLAAGASEEGDAVSSFGSTIALKILSTRRIEAAAYGVYSHRLGRLWLAGGASNAGGAVLAHYFSADDLARYTAQMELDHPTGLYYYPLLTSGERFPIADPSYPPRLTPRPEDPVRFLQAILEGLAAIEAQGYARLAALGAPPLKRIWSSGRTGRNAVLRRLRVRTLGHHLHTGRFESPAAGAALLAAAGSGEAPTDLWHYWPIFVTLGLGEQGS